MYHTFCRLSVAETMQRKNMAGKSGRADKAQEKALEYLGYIMECPEMAGLVEVAGRVGCNHLPGL